MTETINKEPVEGETGATEPPAQPPSETQAEPSAVDEASLKAIIEPLVQDAFDRGAQSTKDKRIAKQESRISSIEDTLAQGNELRADGMSEKQIVQFMRVNEMLESQGLTETPPAQEPAVQTQVAVEDYLSPLLKATGLDANDAGVIEITRKESDPAKRMTAIAQLAETRKQAKETPASPGAVMASGGGQAVESESLEGITEELNALLLKPVTPDSRKRIQELSRKHKELIPKK
jgi:hypothetical protein